MIPVRVVPVPTAQPQWTVHRYSFDLTRTHPHFSPGFSSLKPAGRNSHSSLVMRQEGWSLEVPESLVPAAQRQPAERLKPAVQEREGRRCEQSPKGIWDSGSIPRSLYMQFGMWASKLLFSCSSQEKSGFCHTNRLLRNILSLFCQD